MSTQNIVKVKEKVMCFYYVKCNLTCSRHAQHADGALQSLKLQPKR